MSDHVRDPSHEIRSYYYFRVIPPNYNYKSYRKNYRYNIVFRRINETTVSLHWMLQPHAEPEFLYKEIKPRR